MRLFRNSSRSNNNNNNNNTTTERSNNNNRHRHHHDRMFTASARRRELLYSATVQDHLNNNQTVPTTTGGMPPASEEAIANLFHMRLRALAKQGDLQCLVCSEDFEDGCVVTRLPCGHLYHSDCIVRWLFRSCTCPSCRFELPTDDPIFEKGRKQRMKERRTVDTAIPDTTTWVHDIRELKIDNFDCMVSSNGDRPPVTMANISDYSSSNDTSSQDDDEDDRPILVYPF